MKIKTHFGFEPSIFSFPVFVLDYEDLNNVKLCIGFLWFALMVDFITPSKNKY